MHPAEEKAFHEAIAKARERQRRPQIPARIAVAVNRLLARRGYAQIEQQVEWDEAWRVAVGDHLAEHSKPSRLNQGVLEITVRNSTALQELTFQKRNLLKQLQAVSESDLIRDLRFRVGELY